jgi:hypothetical protein
MASYGPLWDNGNFAPWDFGTMWLLGLSVFGTMGLWNHGALGPLSLGALGLLDHGSLGPWVIGTMGLLNHLVFRP